MRWRYLILAAFLAVPVASAIQVWPQRPAYCIPGERKYLADDPTNNQLLFLQIKKTPEPAVIERFDASTGALMSTTPLEWTDLQTNAINVHEPQMSEDASTMRLKFWHSGRWRAKVVDGKGVAIFDSRTGRCRLDLPDYDHEFDALSGDGRFYAVMAVDPHRLAIIDTMAKQTRLEIPSPTGKGESVRPCFSPDSRYVLLQWGGGETGRTLYLLNLESGREEKTFVLPLGHWLYEWRAGEIQTFAATNGWYEPILVSHYRHQFDMSTLTDGILDPLLACRYSDLKLRRRIDGNSWASQIDSFPPRYSEWAQLLGKLQSTTGVDLLRHFTVTKYSGCRRIVDRRTRRICFEKDVTDVGDYHWALDGTLLIANCDTRQIGSINTGDLEYSGAPFEIYRTDIWRRWICTTLGTSTLLSVFALLAGQSHLTGRAIIRWGS